MRVVRSTLLSLALVLCAAVLTEAGAQTTGTVTGQVTDAATNQPLVGVQVLVAGTNVGTITNQDGRYLLTRVPAGERRVRAILIGYSQGEETVNVSAGSTVTVDIALDVTAVELDAVVASAVTGRDQRARELGTAVETIDIADLNQAPITSLADALSGRAEGLTIQDVGGTSGSSERIRIRGANSLSLSNRPLIYIDGIQMNSDVGGTFGVGGAQGSRLNDINPNNIQTVEVIKGPAASALYGTAAANGVILITTKRGRAGQTNWSAWTEFGSIEDVTDYPVNFGAIDIVDPDAPLFTAAGFLNTVDPETGEGAVIYCPNIDAADGVCTQDQILRFNTLENSATTPFVDGSRQRFGASVRGGGEDVRYFVSGQIEDEQGVMELNTVDKINLRANLDASLGETFELAVRAGYADSRLALGNNDNSIFSPLINGLVGLPYLVPPNPDNPTDNPVNDGNYGFGFNMEELNNLPTFSDVDRFIGSVNGRWTPLPWLSFNATGGLDLTSNHASETLQPDELPIAVSYENGYRQSFRSTEYLYTGQASSVATFQPIESLVSTTTVGGSYSRDNEESTSCFGSSLIPGTASCGTTSSLFSIDEDFFEVITVGAYVQQELGWRDRVFIAGAIRGDDNSAFGQDFGLAYYPSASLSWVLAEEEFFPDLDWLTTLRLRGAWGVSGLRPGFRDAITLFESVTVATQRGDEPGVSLDVTGNPDLEPERTREYEFGFDAGFLNNRLSLEFTYFDKESEHALIERQLAPSLGLTTDFFANLGSVSNTGTELGINVTLLNRENIGLDLSFTSTTLENEIIELGEGVEPIIFDPQRHVEGYSAGGFWAPTLDFNDANNDGLLTQSEISVGDSAVFIGPSIPGWQRSIFGSLRLFDWVTIGSLFEGRGGSYQEDFTENFRCGFESAFGCEAIGNPDAPLHEQAAYIAARYGDAEGDETSVGYIEEADFYKWRELSVSLTMPVSLTDRLGQQWSGLRLTLAGRNLATFTDYPGIDPEIVSDADDNFDQYEFNTLPAPRYLMLRLDYSF